MSAEEWAGAISDAARVVKSRLPRSNSMQLADLVQVGWERALKYLADNQSPSRFLVFLCAKQGMLEEARMWAGRDRHGRKRSFDDPTFVEHDETRDSWDWDQWHRYTLPIEEMIDTKRALLSMQLREAVAWYSHHWLCEELDHLESELGVSEGRIRQYCASAKEKIEAAWQGDWFETEDEISARKAIETKARDARRVEANARMLAERRWRYAELRRMGATHKQAAWGGGAKARFEQLSRELYVEAAE